MSNSKKKEQSESVGVLYSAVSFVFCSKKAEVYIEPPLKVKVTFPEYPYLDNESVIL